MDDYDGKDVLDPDGTRIGTVERTFADDRGIAHFVEVRTGRLFAKHRLIPIDQPEITDGTLRVSYRKGVVAGSPDAASTGDTLEGETLESVQVYYRASGTSETSRGGEEGAAVSVSGAGERPPV
jgi:hypothetical protein